MTTAISDASFHDNPVDKADAASRLTIDHINGIGTEHPGTTFPLLPDTQNSALATCNIKVVATQTGFYQESGQPGFPPRFQKICIEDVFLHYYRRQTTYIFKERHLQGQEDCWCGNLVRTVLEDKLALFQEGSSIPVVGLGQLSSLPLFQEGELVELCGCDWQSNVFALRAFRLGADPAVLLPFKPTRPGIGQLEIDMERKPNVIFDEKALAVLSRPSGKLTFIYLGDHWENIRWPAPCGLSYGIVVRPAANGEIDWRCRERLLNIIASAAGQGISLGVMVEDAVTKGNNGSVGPRSWKSREDFIKDCKDRGMPIPNILEPALLLLETRRSMIPCFPLFGSNGPHTGIGIQGLEPRMVLARVVKAIQRKASFGPQMHFLLVVPDDFVWEAKRAMASSGLSLEMKTLQEIATPELFNQAMHKARANASLLYGFKQNENGKDITKILNWCENRGVPACCIYFGKDNNINKYDYYLYDNVFEALKKNEDYVEFRLKHPEGHTYSFCLDADGLEKTKPNKSRDLAGQQAIDFDRYDILGW
jgi:hypothetical protein